MVYLETFRPDSDAEAITGEPIGEVTARVEPSIIDLERSNWAPTEVMVPLDGTAHWMDYGTHWSFTDATRRQRGEFPTAESALQTGGEGDSGQEQALEALVAMPWSIADAALILPRAVWCRNRVVFSPHEGYERNPWPRPAVGASDQDAGTGARP